jgi:circadian clock protein KaiB
MRDAAMKTRKKQAAKRRPTARKKVPVFELRLYVANATPRSVLARDNVQSLCEEHLAGQYRLTIIDLVKEPELAREHEITAIPTLVRVLPGSQKTIIGSLADAKRVLQALGLDDQPEKYASLLASSHVGNA